VVDKNPHPVIIGGRRYLESNELQFMCRCFGINTIVRSTREVSIGGAQGFEAKTDAILGDGQVISSAVAMCLDDEPRWRDRPAHQLLAMAQTRSERRARLSAVGWVPVLAGYALSKDNLEDEQPPTRKSDEALRERLLAHAAQLLSGFSPERRKAALSRLLKLETAEMCERVAELAARKVKSPAEVDQDQDQESFEDDTKEE
jgi:hypothetical protein